MNRLLACILALGLPACTTARKSGDLAAIYNKRAQAADHLRNPVVLVPGIMGSQLRDEETGKTVWVVSIFQNADPRTPEGAIALALPMANGVPLSRLRDSVGPFEVLDRVTFLFDDHIGITANPTFTDNLLRALLEAPVPR